LSTRRRCNGISNDRVVPKSAILAHVAAAGSVEKSITLGDLRSRWAKGGVRPREKEKKSADVGLRT
jgi:hypothetical protein